MWDGDDDFCLDEYGSAAAIVPVHRDELSAPPAESSAFSAALSRDTSTPSRRTSQSHADCHGSAFQGRSHRSGSQSFRSPRVMLKAESGRAPPASFRGRSRP